MSGSLNLMMNLPPPDLPKPVVLPPAKEGPEPALKPVSVVRDAGNPYVPPVTPVEPAPKETPNLHEAAESFGGLIREAFGFPFRGRDWLIVGMGAVIFFLIVVVGVIPLAALVLVFGVVYLAVYYLDIVAHTLNGGVKLPPWPDLANVWDDLVVPALRMLGITLLSCLPQVLLWWFEPDYVHSRPELTHWLATGFTWLYFPMATLAVVCHGSLWAALPHRVLPALVRCLPGYLVCAAGFGLAELLQRGLSNILREVPAFGWFLPWVVFVYAMMVQARLTGLIYLRYRERMPW